ncbi:unnamed protein product [Paramecium sonneborni]|uniref:Uncharacterized protein n=1 Tax=Paramecium sonneborni TaxID=65129 RepID=A0A8S1MQU7_9CILI|nr:unnamed protein product [Paramecium sonneborni]
MYICQQRIGNQYQLLFIQTQTILIFIILQSNEHYFNLPKRIVISTVNKDKECIDTERIIDFEETIDIIQYNYSEEYECFLLLSEDKKVYKWSSNDSEFSQQLQSYQDEEGFVFEKQFDTDYQSLMLCGSGKFYLLFNKNQQIYMILIIQKFHQYNLDKYTKQIKYSYLVINMIKSKNYLNWKILIRRVNQRVIKIIMFNLKILFWTQQNHLLQYMVKMQLCWVLCKIQVGFIVLKNVVKQQKIVSTKFNYRNIQFYIYIRSICDSRCEFQSIIECIVIQKTYIKLPEEQAQEQKQQPQNNYVQEVIRRKAIRKSKFAEEKQFKCELCDLSYHFRQGLHRHNSQNAQQELDGQLDSIINSSNNELFKQLLKNGVSAQLMSYFELEQFDKDVIQIREQILENAKNTFRWQEAQSLFTSLKITLLSVKEIRNVQDYELNYQIHNLKLQSNIYWLELPKEAINKEDHIKISQQIILTQTYKIILVYYYNKHQIQLEYILNKKHVLCKNLQKQIN